MSGPTKTQREPWHAAKRDRLPREQRADAAMKILGERGQRSDVEAVLDRMEKESEKWKGIRSLDSGSLKTSAKKYGGALDKVIDQMEGAPAALRMPLGMGYSVVELRDRHGSGAKKKKQGRPLVDKPGNPILEGEFPSHDELLRHLRVIRQYCQFYESSKLSQKQQKAAADEKRIAAWGALNLCEVQGIRPTKTKNGRFCRLAAALYGHPSANFLPHCQWVLKKREARQKIADEVRESLAKIPAEVREAWPKAADEVREAWQKSLPKYARLGKKPSMKCARANPCRSNEA